jgi:hypothetical protein
VSDGRAADAILGLIDAQLAEERARKGSLEARGLALITSSGAFVTVTLGIAALVDSKAGYSLPETAQDSLVLGAVFLLIAAVLGVMCNLPLDYDEPKPDSMQDRLREYGHLSLFEGQKAVADSQTASLKAARSKNGIKAGFQLAGALAQVAGMLSVAVAGIAILTH